MNKSNLRSLLIRRSRISNVTGSVISGNHLANGHVIGSMNVCGLGEESPEFLRGKQQAKMEAINHLRSFGLNDDQIMKCLDLILEEIQQIGLKK